MQANKYDNLLMLVRNPFNIDRIKCSKNHAGSAGVLKIIKYDNWLMLNDVHNKMDMTYNFKIKYKDQHDLYHHLDRICNWYYLYRIVMFEQIYKYNQEFIYLHSSSEFTFIYE